MDNQKERRHFLKYFCSLMAFCATSVLSFKKNNGLTIGKSGPIGSISRSEAQTVGNTVSRMKKIAVEEHFTTEKILSHLGSRVKSGARFNMPISYEVNAHTPALIGDKRLKDMDEAGIDMQVISPVCFQDGLVDPSEATALAKLTNDELYEIIQKYPKRFAGFAGLACQDPDAAAKELERAVKELGLKGAMIYSHIQGEYLDAKKFWVIFETAERLGVPIYLHPKEPSPDMIKPYSTYPALAGKIWGYAAEAGLHAMRLIFSGLFDKYPDLKIILGHGGEGLPALMWRMGMDSDSSGGSQLPGQPGQSGIKKQPGNYVKDNFYVTTSGMFWVPVLQFLHSAMGPDRVLFAVDYPAESNILAVKAIESMSISDEDKGNIFHLNTEKLLKM
ncbi:amidohydrolase family protein [Deltaproteobacteria bacterium]|nr:amidohydrolase family protein [Deltaproteobacteria bacterium]